MFWNRIISKHWTHLAAGKRLWLEVVHLNHPANDRRFRPNVGWPDGQICDYTLSLSDGSRIHAQCFGENGGRYRLRLHRDKFDPDQGIANFVLHGLLETPFGALAASIVLLGSLGAPR